MLLRIYCCCLLVICLSTSFISRQKLCCGTSCSSSRFVQKSWPRWPHTRWRVGVSSFSYVHRDEVETLSDKSQMFPRTLVSFSSVWCFFFWQLLNVVQSHRGVTFHLHVLLEVRNTKAAAVLSSCVTVLRRPKRNVFRSCSDPVAPTRDVTNRKESLVWFSWVDDSFKMIFNRVDLIDEHLLFKPVNRVFTESCFAFKQQRAPLLFAKLT